MKRLTIIVPTYNMEEYLDKCLTSLIVPDPELMDQLEVLVVNDGSRDCSAEIAHEYEVMYPATFRVIDKENGNYGSCINAALPVATGKYVKVLDADDWFDNGSLCIFLEKLAEYDVDLFLTKTNVVNPEGRIIETFTQDGLFSFDQILPFRMLNNTKFCAAIMMHNVAYKTENLKKIHYRQTEGISYTDQLWIHLPMITVETFVSLDVTLYYYLFGREGQTVSCANLRNNFTDERQVDIEIIDNCLSYKGDKEHTDYLFKRMILHQASIYQGGIFEDHYKYDDIVSFDHEIRQKYRDIYQMLGNNYLWDYRRKSGIKISLWRNPILFHLFYPIKIIVDRIRVKLALGRLIHINR